MSDRYTVTQEDEDYDKNEDTNVKFRPHAMKPIGRNPCNIPPKKGVLLVVMVVVLMLGHESTAVSTLPQDQLNMSLILRDKIGYFAPLLALTTRSVLECVRRCGPVPGVVFISFMPDSKKCWCQSSLGVFKRSPYTGAVTYEFKHCKLICSTIYIHLSQPGVD